MPFDKYKVAEARAQFSVLLDRANAGEEILVTKGREPQARIVPPPEAARREPAPLANLRLPDDLFDHEDREQAAIDAGEYSDDPGIWRGRPAAS
ncbi:MAG: type II toxin-antitoxin system prevent-host-death family antitoxin [Thiotrichales bacterium]|nr:type II toxin-antitoxin system prevent-host-death family antitoxin [Thiotrichales bacterium]MCY4350386.1 type II toxin-antitoxin system prevent-host-death family antitoxin [Thiotrichales bacterium]